MFLLALCLHSKYIKRYRTDGNKQNMKNLCCTYSKRVVVIIILNVIKPTRSSCPSCSVSARVKDCAILEPYVQTDESPLEFNPQCKIRIRGRSDLMVESLTRDRRVTGSSLTCDTAAVCVLEKGTLISSKYCFNPGRPT